MYNRTESALTAEEQQIYSLKVAIQYLLKFLVVRDWPALLIKDRGEIEAPDSWWAEMQMTQKTT